MINSSDLLEWQRDQYEHDMKYHFDILSRHKQDRLKHYAMHFGKYAGRIARGASEEKPPSRTFADAMLVCLSAANTLHQRLEYVPNASNEGLLLRLTDAQGRMNDATEKIDHLEDFVAQAAIANQDILNALLDFADSEQMDAFELISERRRQLRLRHFYIR
jgi:hypothetical protein